MTLTTSIACLQCSCDFLSTEKKRNVCKSPSVRVIGQSKPRTKLQGCGVPEAPLSRARRRAIQHHHRDCGTRVVASIRDTTTHIHSYRQPTPRIHAGTRQEKNRQNDDIILAYRSYPMPRPLDTPETRRINVELPQITSEVDRELRVPVAEYTAESIPLPAT
jgi:hypothetical protein